MVVLIRCGVLRLKEKGNEKLVITEIKWCLWEGCFGGGFKKTTMVLQDEGDWNKTKFCVTFAYVWHLKTKSIGHVSKTKYNVVQNWFDYSIVLLLHH